MSDWPELPIAAWTETCRTLQLYLQIVGKIRLALTPRMNEWWNVPLYVTTRGLTTSPMPYADRLVSIDFDFVDHRLLFQDTSGRTRAMPLEPRPVSQFHSAVFAELDAMGVAVRIDPMPQECPDSTPFTEDHAHRSYDRAQVNRFWQVLTRVEPVFQRFRAGFRGKCSPVHLFWGGMDLAVSRFNGRRAPARKGLVERLAYDEEVSSLGFWPGDAWGGAADAMFYAYTVPTPSGLPSERVRPSAAAFDRTLQEFVLPYADVRRAPDPERAILDFAQSTYDRGSTLAGWNRGALAYP